MRKKTINKEDVIKYLDSKNVEYTFKEEVKQFSYLAEPVTVYWVKFKSINIRKNIDRTPDFRRCSDLLYYIKKHFETEAKQAIKVINVNKIAEKAGLKPFHMFKMIYPSMDVRKLRVVQSNYVHRTKMYTLDFIERLAAVSGLSYNEIMTTTKEHKSTKKLI